MTVKSAARVMEILDLLRDYPEGLTFQDLCARLEIPKSSMHELLYTMTERNYLIQSDTKKYMLGFKLIELGLASLDRVNVYQIAKQYMSQIVDRIEETVFMAVDVNDEIVYVNKLECSRSVRTNVILGDRKPMHCTALGKSFLASLPQKELREIVERKGLPKFTPQTITDFKELVKELEKVRKDGIAYDDQEIEEGLSCVATPIFDHSGNVIAAISIAGPSARIEVRKNEICTVLKEYSQLISGEMGFRANRN